MELISCLMFELFLEIFLECLLCVSDIKNVDNVDNNNGN